MAGDHPFDAELLPHPYFGRFAQLRRQRPVGEETIGELGETDGVAGSDQETGLPVDQQFAVGWNVAGDDGNSRRHRFHHAVGHPFEIAAQPEDIEQRKEPGGVVAAACESHQVMAIEVACERFDFVAFRSIADDSYLGGDRRSAAFMSARFGSDIIVSGSSASTNTFQRAWPVPFEWQMALNYRRPGGTRGTEEITLRCE